MDSDKPDDDAKVDKTVQATIQEQLSAFVDGELPMEEMELLLRRLERDGAHRATFSRYVTIGNMMRGDAGQSDRIRASVMQQVTEIGQPAAESAASAPKAANLKVIGFAVAAGLCAVAVINILPKNLAVTGNQPVAAISESAPASAVNRQERFSGRYRQPGLVRSDRMASYLASHGTHAQTISWRVAEPGFVIQQARYTQ